MEAIEKKWVDFRAIKQAVPLSQVLARYGIKLKKSGKELRGRCPVHNGEGEDSFNASTEKNVFHCFSCRAKGNVLDFVAAMENCSLRQAALLLSDWFALPSIQPAVTNGNNEKASQPKPAREETIGESAQPNQPLGFRLRGIDFSHPYLSGRGIDSETAEYFGVGYFSGKGSMAGRVVIPIDNEHGQLVAYAGRSIDGTEPKYRLPAGFKKSQVLYNLARAKEECSDGTVVLVEGFFDCMKVVLAGYPCVSLIGCAMSEHQERLLATNFQRVLIMLDGDEAGRSGSGEVSGRIAQHIWTRVIMLPEGCQPDQLAPPDLQGLLVHLV